MRVPVLATLIIVPVAAAAAQTMPSSTPHVPTDHWVVPGTAYEIAIGTPVVESDTGLPPDALLRAIATWVSLRTALPEVVDLPKVALATREEMTELRYRKTATELRADSWDPEVVSLYEQVDDAILLPVGWSGDTPAGLSILVHEMVHHLQTAAKLRYACPEEREALAFGAQQQWLEQFGTNLAEQFGIDGLTLLVRTHCPM